MFLYSNVTQNNELEMESLSEYAHNAGLLLLGSDSPRSACLKSNTHSLIQSSFYLPPLKISVKNCIWDTWSVWFECRHGKHEKKSRGQLITHPLMFQCHEQRRTCLCTAAFLVLAERKILGQSLFESIYWNSTTMFSKTEYKSHMREIQMSLIFLIVLKGK